MVIFKNKDLLYSLIGETALINETLNNEKDLVLALKKGEEAAYSYLYDQYGAALYGHILKMTSNQELSKDLLQEVFIKVFQKINQYDEQKGLLYTWLIRVAHNTTLDKIKSSHFQNNLQTFSLDEKRSDSGNQGSVTTNIDHIGMEKVLTSLDNKYKQVIDLAYFHGLTQNEIAEQLGEPVGTIKTKVRKALIQLRKILNIV